MDYGVRGAGDRGGGTSSPSPSAPPPVAISTRSTAWGDPGEEPDTTAHQVSPRTDPAPRVGRGRSAAGAGGVGEAGEKCIGSLPPKAWVGWELPAEACGYPCEGTSGVGAAGRSVWMACRREVRWLECGRQGRGNEFPLPVGPTPRGDIHTVHSMGRPWRRAGHDCPPDIATHGPRPVGAGEERRRRGWGGGGRRGIRASASEGTDGVEAADRSAWVSLAAGVGGVEAASRSVWYPPAGVGGVLE